MPPACLSVTVANKYILLHPGSHPASPGSLEGHARRLSDHRTEEFGQIFDSVIKDMQYVYRTEQQRSDDDDCSGTGTMESPWSICCPPATRR